MTRPPALQYSSPAMERSARPQATRFVVFAILGIVIGAGRLLLGAFTLLTLLALGNEPNIPTDYLAFSVASLLLAVGLLVGSILSLFRRPSARKLIVVVSIFDTVLPVMIAIGMLAQLSTGYGDDVPLIWIVIAVRFVQGLTWWLVYRTDRARDNFEGAAIRLASPPTP